LPTRLNKLFALLEQASDFENVSIEFPRFSGLDLIISLTLNDLIEFKKGRVITSSRGESGITQADVDSFLQIIFPY
jgi:hypothetical protein